MQPPGLLASVEEEDAVEIGRGDKTAIVPRTTAGQRLELADEWVSQVHAVLRGRELEDAGSRNGTRVNGLAVKTARLEDGDLVELGHTLLCFRVRPADVAQEACTAAAALRETDELTLSPTFLAEVERARRVAKSHLPILITGETGAGKEVLARAVHAWSGR